MSTTPRRITIEDVIAQTGLGPIQTRADVKAGLLPGRMRGRQYVCPPGEYQKWLDGDWTPRPQPQPVQMIQRKKAA